jgi:hypothetical protein
LTKEKWVSSLHHSAELAKSEFYAFVTGMNEQPLALHTNTSRLRFPIFIKSQFAHSIAVLDAESSTVDQKFERYGI